MAKRGDRPLSDLELRLLSCAQELQASGLDWFDVEEIGEEHRHLIDRERRLGRNPLQTALNHLVRIGMLTKRWETPQELDIPRPLRVVYKILGAGEPKYRTPRIRAHRARTTT